MIRLYCRGNVIEYTGDGWLQCSRSVACPKKKNNKILGFDCLLYIDGLPENVKLLSPEIELPKEQIKEIKEVKEVPKEPNDTSREPITPIIVMHSKDDIKEKVKGNGKDKEKQDVEQSEDTDIIDVSIIPLIQKIRHAEQVQA